MCKYLIVKEHELNECSYTKHLCTMCVVGNGKTFKQAEEHNNNKLKFKK